MLFRYGSDSKGRPVKKAVIYTKNEHGISRDKIDFDALYIIDQLKAFGYEAYIVGGAVRDLLIGKEPKDFDIVTDATPTKIKKIFRNSRVIGRRFRLVHVFFDSKVFEVSTFRSISDGSVGNRFGSMDEDVQRRDFTLNALYFDVQKEQVIDYVGGVNDIRKCKVKPIIAKEIIFQEDPVRMLRAIKYAATTGCGLSYSLKRHIRCSAHLLSPVSPSRLTEELLKIINSGYAYDIVKLALDMDLYMYLQPAATALIYSSKKFEQNYFNHLKELDSLHKKHHDARLGQKLFYLIYDFAKGLTDWKKEVQKNTAVAELYSLAWGYCRSFVLPMNPQRVELEFAVRLVLRDLGVAVNLTKKNQSQEVVQKDFSVASKKAKNSHVAKGKGVPSRRKRKSCNSTAKIPEITTKPALI